MTAATRATTIVAATALLLTACSGATDTTGAEDPVPADGGEGVDEPVEPVWPHAGEELVIGRINALDGAFATAAEDAERTVQMAIDEFGGEVAGRPIRTIVERSDTTPETTLARARKLVEEDGVHIIHGPLSGGEGMALSDYAHSIPDVTFVDGASAGAATTLDNPAPNYFRWHSDGAMWTAPLGAYVVEDLGYTNIAFIAEDYAFPHAQVGGFLESYCAAGGAVAEAFWIPLAGDPFYRIVSELSDDLDAVFLVLGVRDAMDFFSAAEEFDVQVPPIIASSIMVGTDLLRGEPHEREMALGIAASSGPLPPADAELPAWQAFLDDYRQLDGRRQLPSMQAVLFYNSMRALLEGIEAADGVVESDGGASLRAAMREMTVDSPIGPLNLNDNNQASTDVFIYDVREDSDGRPKTHLLEVAEGVEQGTRLWERLDDCP